MNIKDYEQDVTHYAVEITKYLVSRGASLEDAEDTVQDTIVILLDLDVLIEPRKLRAFMYRVSIRNYINKYRRASKYAQIIEEIGRGLSEFAEEKRTIDLSELLTKLSKKDAKLLTQFYYENLSVNEIAQKTGFSVSKIKVNLYRARKKLKKILEEKGYDGFES
ncbi:RNA polymerase sigma factor [Lactococcus nasutitermitis]|uniref:RNA polymerase sigma factor n=1 Tax=Lactococcus nasutitermitis TaxID=1652957 RepID=A0ABV9JGP4_9LACT|nr:sigma-70 family RNA polymerase sigma factor [Lactococcus nasutitermitis]